MYEPAQLTINRTSTPGSPYFSSNFQEDETGQRLRVILHFPDATSDNEVAVLGPVGAWIASEIVAETEENLQRILRRRNAARFGGTTPVIDSESFKAAVRDVAAIAARKPNDAKTFQAVVSRLARIPGVSLERAEKIASETLPGSARAFRDEKVARARRLMTAVKRGGLI